MWILDLIIGLMALIFALILFLIFAAILAIAIVVIGYLKEEICDEEEKGFFHKVADKIGMFD